LAKRRGNRSASKTNGNGTSQDAQATRRFTVITQRGIGWFERGTNELQNNWAGRHRAEIAPIERRADQTGCSRPTTRHLLPSDDGPRSGGQYGISG
jgi:hypothetical protein